MSDTTGITMSPPDPSISIENRLKRERSHRSGAHNGSISKVVKTTTQQEKDNVSVPQKNVIPIFLQKTYQMISECEPDLAEWTLDGEKFVVKDPTEFAQKVIPNFFDHCNFPSFARQLNFYGFHKVQVKPVRHTDIDKSKDKHVTFCNENFKRGRKELLSNIQRSTRGGGNNVNLNQQQRQIELLKTEVLSYEKQVMQLNVRMKLMEDKFSDLVEQLKPNQTQQVQSMNYKFDLNTINSKENSEANVEDLSRQFSLTSLKGDISSLKEHSLRSPYLDRCKDEPDDNKNGIASNSFSKLSQPTLKPHPKAKNKLPPGPVSPVYQESVDSGGLSNESLFGNDTFERNLFTAFILDETNDNHDDTKPNDDVWTTAA